MDICPSYILALSNILEHFPGLLHVSAEQCSAIILWSVLYLISATILTLGHIHELRSCCSVILIRQSITSPPFYNLECTSIHFATGYKLSGNSPAGQNGGSCCCYLQVERVRVRAHDTHKPLKILPPVKIIASLIMDGGPSVFSLGIAPNFCLSQPSFCYTKAKLDTRQHMWLAMPGHMRKFRG